MIGRARVIHFILTTMSRLPAELTFDLVAAEDVPAAHALETAGKVN